MVSHSILHALLFKGGIELSDENLNCTKTIIANQLVKTQAVVTIEPIAQCGDPKVYCIGSNVKPRDDRKPKPKSFYPIIGGRSCDEQRSKCSFTLTQLLCIEIPIEIDVDIDLEQEIVCCGTPRIGPCTPRVEELNYEAEYEELNPDPDLSVIEPEKCKEANLQDTDNEYEELKMQPANLEKEEHISHNEEE
jgi:hypothetical protein